MRTAVATLFLLTLSASAQTFEQTTYLRTNEQPMSARSAAMGGASDALASDASDLASNPAFIASLQKTSFSLSAAQSGYQVTRFDELSRVRGDETSRSLSHVSFAVPLRNFVFGAYYRDEPRLRHNKVGPPEGTAEYAPDCLFDSCFYVGSVDAAAFDRRDRRYGVTAAMERGNLSFGAGLELQQLDEAFDLPMIGLPAAASAELLMQRTSGQAYVPNAGVRWRVTPRVAIAAAYNGGGTFDTRDDRCLVDFATATCTSRYQTISRARVDHADAYRASIAIAPIDGLVFTGEAIRRNYSDESNRTQLFGPQLAVYPYRDVTDVHAGAEYRVPGVPVSLRAGWWREEARNLYGPFELLGDVDHRTIGAGIDVGGARIDVAYDDAPVASRAIVGVTWTR